MCCSKNDIQEGAQNEVMLLHSEQPAAARSIPGMNRAQCHSVRAQVASVLLTASLTALCVGDAEVLVELIWYRCAGAAISVQLVSRNKGRH